MKKIILILMLLISAPTQAADWYFEIAIGVKPDNEMGMPEVNLPGPLGKFVIGVEAQNNWAIEFEHISSLPYQEQGKGLNALWFIKRVYF